MKMLDRENLNFEFDMEPIEMVEKSSGHNTDPIDTLKGNIDRANDVLDLLEMELRSGNMSARMAEVYGQLVNSVTNASKEIISGMNYKAYLQIREKMIRLKELEIKIKEKQVVRPSSQNIIVTDRESVLKLLEENRKIEQEQNTK